MEVGVWNKTGGWSGCVGNPMQADRLASSEAARGRRAAAFSRVAGFDATWGEGCFFGGGTANQKHTAGLRDT